MISDENYFNILTINILYSYFRNMRDQNGHDLWTVIFLIAVLLQDSLLATNTKNAMTKKQTSSCKGNYNYYLSLACQRVTSNFYINLIKI